MTAFACTLTNPRSDPSLSPATFDTCAEGGGHTPSTRFGQASCHTSAGRERLQHRRAGRSPRPLLHPSTAACEPRGGPAPDPQEAVLRPPCLPTDQQDFVPEGSGRPPQCHRRVSLRLRELRARSDPPRRTAASRIVDDRAAKGAHFRPVRHAHSSSTHGACSQSGHFLNRFSNATSDRSANCALRALTTVSRSECPQPGCNSRVRSSVLGDLSLSSFLKAPVLRASPSQSSGTNDSGNSHLSERLTRRRMHRHDLDRALEVLSESFTMRFVVATNKLASMPPTPPGLNAYCRCPGRSSDSSADLRDVNLRIRMLTARVSPTLFQPIASQLGWAR